MGVNNNGMLFHFSVNKCPLLLVSYELKVSTVVVSLANQLAQPGIFTSAGVYTLIWGNNYDLLFLFWGVNKFLIFFVFNRFKGLFAELFFIFLF